MNILELAKQAGLKRHQEQAPGIDGVVGSWADLEAFANLVRADEREACCAIVYGQCGSDNVAQRTVDAIRARGTT